MDLLGPEKLISLYVGSRRIGKNKYVKTWLSPKLFSASFKIRKNYPATALADPGGRVVSIQAKYFSIWILFIYNLTS